MKYFILVPDGAADYEIESLGGKTPLEASNITNINKLASIGEVGMLRTVPEGIAPGSDAANLSVMGYNPAVYLTGRSPLEAASIGINMSDTDVAFRANIVTLEGEGAYEDLIVKDHSSGDITTEEADVLIKLMQEEFGNEQITFYTGVSYRHCMIAHNASIDYQLTPPHDILERRAGEYMPKGKGSEEITDMMKRSYEILKNHPVNIARIEKGLNPANSLWIWGQGRKPSLELFTEKYGVGGVAISAVDLIKGIAINAGLKSIDVEGATGTIHTNYEGKAQATIKAFEDGNEFVYLHMEGPDECSHQGDLQGKIECMEIIDQKILKPVIDYLENCGDDYKVLIVPDHRTPLCIRTHSSEHVPFVLFDSKNPQKADETKKFNEKSGAFGKIIDEGHTLADCFFAK